MAAELSCRSALKSTLRAIFQRWNLERHSNTLRSSRAAVNCQSDFVCRLLAGSLWLTFACRAEQRLSLFWDSFSVLLALVGRDSILRPQTSRPHCIRLAAFERPDCAQTQRAPSARCVNSERSHVVRFERTWISLSRTSVLIKLAAEIGANRELTIKLI